MQGRLTTQCGIAYDQLNTYYPTANSNAMKTVSSTVSSSVRMRPGEFVDWNTVSPRVGLAFDVTGKELVRASITGGTTHATVPASRYRKPGWTGKQNLYLDRLKWRWNPADQRMATDGAATFASGASGGCQHAHQTPNMSRPYSEQNQPQVMPAVAAGRPAQLALTITITARRKT